MNHVILEKKGPIAVMTLNDRSKRNSLNPEFLQEIEEAVIQVEQDHSLYVLIITGADPVFIAGGDIKLMLDITPQQALDYSRVTADVITRIERLRVPVIAAVNGYALGGGTELCLACDLRIASERASFGQPECTLGITPGAGGTQRLPRLIGLARAKELLYTGRIISAAEADRVGLVNRVVAHEKLMDEAMGLAEEICKNAQIAVQQIKRCVNDGVQTDIHTGIAYEQHAFAVTVGTEDKRIGMTAFLNKDKEKHFVYR